ncbi:DegT/DnrJ/EryC1/StrS family aminotransferase [Deltaproteobacteria bacterium TL4]
MKKKLALFGGDPVRKAPFKNSVNVDKEEILSVLDCFRNNEFSRYAGGPGSDVKQLLTMKSVEAETFPTNYWNFLGGPKVKTFEARCSQYFGSAYAIAVNSATSGITTALAACDIGPGDEVIVTCMSFTATGTAIIPCGAIPVFVDVDPYSLCIDPQKIEEKITSKTKAILLVHLLGTSAEMDEICAIARKHQLRVLEDCAQAPGTLYKGKKVGSIGDAGIFSLQETKNFMSGEGGVIITNDVQLAKKCRLIRNHGETIINENDSVAEMVNVVGFNFRMTEMTAALASVQLGKLDKLNEIRTQNTNYLLHQLQGLEWIEFYQPPSYIKFVPHLLGWQYNAKKAGVPRAVIVAALRAEGMPVGTGYLRLLYENPLFLKKIAFGDKGYPFSLCENPQHLDYKKGLCPVGEQLIKEKCLWFYHIHAPNTLEDMKEVVEAFKKVDASLKELQQLDSGKISVDYQR